MRMQLKFDDNGLLNAGIYDLSIEELELIFVKEQKEKVHRNRLFQQYLLYINDIKNRVGTILFQFINGSFTTLKDKPNDIDIVTFLDYRIFRDAKEEVNYLAEKWDSIQEIDGYIIPKSYPGHPLFIQSQLTYEYWFELFSLSRSNESGAGKKKGFIKINFHEG